MRAIAVAHLPQQFMYRGINSRRHFVFFCCWLIAIAFTLGCGRRNAASVEAVLRADAIAFQEAKSAAEFVTRVRAISLQSCPSDFKVAYFDRIHPCEKYAAIEQRIAAFRTESTSSDAMAEAFIRGMFGDLGKPREVAAAGAQLDLETQQATLSIKQTYEQVEIIAVSHGANLPARDGS